MSDRIEYLSRSLIQHGSGSSRIYLMSLCPDDLPELVAALDMMAVQKGYTKIFCKIPQPHANHFLSSGYRVEAEIPRMFNHKTTGLFLGRYFTEERSVSSDEKSLESILKRVIEERGDSTGNPLRLPDDVLMRKCGAEDIQDMCIMYSNVFSSYPFPIFREDYLLSTMEDHVDYFGAFTHDGSLVALASTEKNLKAGNAEMTDFATIPSMRGKGLARALLSYMEQELPRKDFPVVYTIARALSPGMNRVFAASGYSYGGRLINNTQISGTIESMNVWYKVRSQKSENRGQMTESGIEQAGNRK